MAELSGTPRGQGRRIAVVASRFNEPITRALVDGALDALVRHGTINREDLRLFHRTDSADEAFEIVTRHLTEYAMAERGAFL